LPSQQVTRQNMNYQSYTPPIALAGLIQAIEVYHANWNEDKELPAPYVTCLANTQQCLYFYLRDGVKVIPAENVEFPSPTVVVTGPKSKPVGLRFGKDHLMVKVLFHPTGTYRLLGIQMQKAVNNGLDAREFWGNELDAVLSDLRQTSSYQAMADIVAAFLQTKVDVSCRPEEPIDLVVMKMLEPANNHALEAWADMACLSLRQFERNFATRTGISPKLFIRIVRFEHAMQLKNENEAKSWTEIATACGYTDSSHLLREFKEFAEFTPGKFYEQPTSGHSEFPTG
jgi:AraC-like DNA-binding protein